jgi:hypothetical protein
LSAALADPRHAIDLIHNQGLWRIPNVYAGRATVRQKVPVMLSPRGGAHAILTLARSGLAYAFETAADLAALAPTLADGLGRLVGKPKSLGLAGPASYAPYAAADSGESEPLQHCRDC